VRMFLDEARLAALISHPNVVQIFDVGEFEGNYFIAMEYINGPPVATVVRRLRAKRAAIPWEVAGEIVAQSGDGLHAAHELKDDSGKLLQLVVNLLLNAAQAIGPGPAVKNHVCLRLRVASGIASLFIEETGCGIPADQLDKIFAPFFTTKGNQGTGIGLAICKQIVEELGGSIQVESAVGKGSRFEVRLPARD